MKRTLLKQTLLAASLASLGFASFAQSLPVGGVIAAGTGSISTAGNVMTVNQSSAKMVANWQSFNIGAGNKVIFNQVNSNAIALNRVMGTTASSINGQLQANGTVILLNPNGIAFGAGSQVNVGGLVASTHKVTDAAFMSNASFPMVDAGTGTVSNAGTLSATRSAGGANILLSGRTVINTGTIQSNLGQIALLASPNLYYSPAPAIDMNGVLNDTKASTTALAVTNTGVLNVDGGGIVLAAGTRGPKVNSPNAVVINSGDITLKNSYLNVYATGNAGVSSAINSSGAIKTLGAANAINMWAFGSTSSLILSNKVIGTASNVMSLEGGKTWIKNASLITNGGYLGIRGSEVKLENSEIDAKNGFSMSGTASGIKFTGINTLKTNGPSTIFGQSTILSTAGVEFEANSKLNLYSTYGGIINLNGVARNNANPNVNLFNVGVKVSNNATINNLGQNSLSITGMAKGSNAIGVELGNNATVRNQGPGSMALNGTVEGNNSGAGSYGVKINKGSKILNEYAGSIFNVTGVAVAGTGLWIEGATVLNKARMSLSGLSNTGIGLDIASTSITNTDRAHMLLKGTSTSLTPSNFGVRIRDRSSLSKGKGGTFTVAGASQRTDTSLSIASDSVLSASITKSDAHR